MRETPLSPTLFSLSRSVRPGYLTREIERLQFAADQALEKHERIKAYKERLLNSDWYKKCNADGHIPEALFGPFAKFNNVEFPPIKK